jgi:alkylation response protein AidB-like acyl-CoA dehydrogenase
MLLNPCWHPPPTGDLLAKTARWSMITQIYEGTNQIQRMMARQLLNG